jgi:predicted GIY-YIG superfamily endonuclease
MVKHGVYFLTDTTQRKSYIGYSPDILNRWRCHSLKLKASSDKTKKFDGCHLVTRIEGFPTKKIGLSFEWYCKSHRKLSVREGCLKLARSPHKRLENIFAPLLHEKFRYLRQNLTVFVHDPELRWSTSISEFYNVDVKQMPIPYHPSHINVKKKFKYSP